MRDIEINDTMSEIEKSCYEYIIHLKRNEIRSFTTDENIRIDDFFNFWITKSSRNSKCNNEVCQVQQIQDMV
jgi:hypothetical protein